MSRPSLALNTIANKTQGWDTEVNDNFSVLKTQLQDEPLPPAQFADLATLNSAHDPADYEGCIAFAGTVLYISDGSAWNPVGTQGAAVADLSLTASAGYVQSEAQAVADKLDELLGSLRASGVIDT